jgi:peptidyl-prolyl cis-trans isomerase SurA
MFVFIILISLFNVSLNSAPKVAVADKARIAAVVNQHAITEYELNCRLDFAIATLNMPKTKESRDSMRHSVLQNLIVEKLQSTSATEAGIKISDEDVKGSLENLAQDNGMTLAQLMDKFKEMGIKIDTLKDRLRAQVLWGRFIRAMYGRQIKITDGDIEKEFGKIQRNIDSDQYELIEIILPIDSKNPAKTKQDADRLYQQVSRPMTNFRMVAQQFGAQSGYAGWKNIKQMDEEVAKAIQKLPVGEVTRPIEVQNSYRIIKLVDKKLAGQGSFRSRKISVARAGIRLPEEMTEENVAILENITQHIKSAKSCNEFQKLGKDANGHVEVSAEQPMTSFPEPLQVILDKVAPNQVAGPIQDGSEVSFFMVCTVKNPEKETLPSKKEIKIMLEQKEFSRRATSLLNKFMSVARIAVTDESTPEKNSSIKRAREESAPEKNTNTKRAKKVEFVESEQAQ